jgi:hypothetical protein
MANGPILHESLPYPIWTFAAITAPFVIFCLTKNPASFYGFSTLAPPLILWSGFAKFLLMDERRFELEKMRLESRRGENINWGRSSEAAIYRKVAH